MRKWLPFLLVLLVALGYGLVLRDKAPLVAPAPAPGVQAPIYAASDADDSGVVKRAVVLMGSEFVFAVDAPRPQALAAITAVTERLRQLEAEISSWKPGSDTYRLNDNAGRFITVGADTLALLQLSQLAHAQTGGSFDISIGAVWDLYPFRDAQRPLPTAAEIDAQLKFVGADRIDIRPATAEARLPAGMRINFGGIGKGYAAAIAMQEFRAMGISNAAVSAGGDVYLLGRKHSGPWLIRIENPHWPGKTIEQFALRDRSVATSGNSQRFIERDGKRYGHIIDPRSGRPAEGTQSVTLIADTPALADAYATAVFVKGPVAGMQWVDAQAGIEALIIDANGSVTRSRGWQAATTAAAP